MLYLFVYCQKIVQSLKVRHMLTQNSIHTFINAQRQRELNREAVCTVHLVKTLITQSLKVSNMLIHKTIYKLSDLSRTCRWTDTYT